MDVAGLCRAYGIEDVRPTYGPKIPMWMLMVSWQKAEDEYRETIIRRIYNETTLLGRDH